MEGRRRLPERAACGVGRSARCRIGGERGGAVIEAASSDTSVQGVRRFLEILAAEPRVSATAIQTVGLKGYDGFAVALVIADPSTE